MVSTIITMNRERFICFSLIGCFAATTVMSLTSLHNSYAARASEYRTEDIPTQHADLARAVTSFGSIDKLIKQALSTYNASRVSVLRIHDGPTDLSKTTLFSVSVANIVAKPGVLIAPEEETDIPASVFAEVLPQLIDHKAYTVLTNNIPNDGLREILEKRQTVESLWIPIVDSGGNLIGMLSADWTDTKAVPLPQDAMINNMTEISKKISSYFSLPPINDLHYDDKTSLNAFTRDEQSLQK
jgi:hypothetical protein